MPRLVLLRHGESIWNHDNRFSGWTDVDLTETGVGQAKQAAALLKAHDIQFDHCFTSVLKRAIHTLWIVLDEMDLAWLPVSRSWRLNERHYGALQGRNKDQMREEVGNEQVHKWRRSYTTRPPLLDEKDNRYPGREPKYASIPHEQIPLGESLEDTVGRPTPLLAGAYRATPFTRRQTPHRGARHQSQRSGQISRRHLGQRHRAG